MTGRPLPNVTDENRHFWDSCREGRLAMQQCRHCRHIRYPIAPVCPECLEESTDWVNLSGLGEVFSYMVFHQVYHPAFAAEIPYNVALVKLDEGPRMISNIVGVPNDSVKVGDRVTVVFDPIADDVSIPHFRPLSGAGR